MPLTHPDAGCSMLDPLIHPIDPSARAVPALGRDDMLEGRFDAVVNLE